MTREQAINLLQVMLLDERRPPKLCPESFAARLRPALLEREIARKTVESRAVRVVSQYQPGSGPGLGADFPPA